MSRLGYRIELKSPSMPSPICLRTGHPDVLCEIQLFQKIQRFVTIAGTHWLARQAGMYQRQP